jgi:hypothetical protein
LFETDIESEKKPEHTGSFMYWSVPFYWFREWRLSKVARGWTPTQAIVEGGYRSKGGYRETIRAELRYSYEFDRQQFSGVTVRECVFDTAAAKALAYDHSKGDQITVFVDPADPGRSYFPSGFGALEPVLTGLLALIGTSLVLLIVIAGLIGNLR